MAPASKNARIIKVGCAGWSIPAQYRDSFPAIGTALQRYAAVFNAVEINSSFCRQHKQATYVRWGESVRADFRFSVKVPKLITHDFRLKGIASELKSFLSECTGLRDRLGGVLVQLPPSLEFNARVAKAFFERLRGQLPAGVQIACEPRHVSWLENGAEEMLTSFDVNRVGADPFMTPSAQYPGTGGGWRYWRLHGSPHMYYSAYPQDALVRLADAIHDSPPGAVHWVMFDNTAAGHAVGNALALQKLVQAITRSRQEKIPARA